MTRLIIAEKPSMGRDIAAALGATRRGDGFIESGSDIVTWCIGHLVELDDPEAYDARFKSWRGEHLPIIPEAFKYHPAERTAKQFHIIKELLARADVTTVVNAADAGREGELIFDLVYSLARCRKPIERLWISSLTRDAIIEGFNNLKPATHYAGLRDSARARQQSDWLVGLNATRAQTIKARTIGRDGVYSLGRVQTPTLALIVRRDREIKDFVPTDYFEVHADFKATAGSYRGVHTNAKGETRFDKKEEADAIAAKVTGKHGTVEKVERKATRERPPLLYDLTTLQRAANARFAFSAATTLELAQSLYEKKFLTYPRTSSRHLSSDVAKDIQAHVEATRIGRYIPFVETIINVGKLKLTARHVDDKKVTDHHAVIPTKQLIRGDNLTIDEKRIYDLVARRFLAAFYPDAELERTTITTIVEGEKFTTRGTVIVKAGWREVDPPGRNTNAERAANKIDDDEDADAGELPRVVKDDAVDVTKAEATPKQTKAPPRFTEASLLGAMETAGKKIEDDELRLAMKDSGLGTPATRAAVIETLIKREYITRDKKSLTATVKGISLVAMLPSETLKSAELTGQWERKLAQMARGEYSFAAFMSEVKTLTTELVREISTANIEPQNGDDARHKTHLTPHIARPENALDCPKCKREERAGFLVERTGTSGKFLACALGREACGYLTDSPKNARQRKALVETVCATCGAAMRLRVPKERDKTAFLSCVAYPDCTGRRNFDAGGKLMENVVEEVAEVRPKCGECGTPMLKRGPASSGNYFWSCPRWRSDGTGCKSKPVWINEGRGAA
ncbi:MAG: DNA topoisomerase 3 [Pyrinomonadaceae bacterium MAG19_C2-C3]|nr:DNA topoisomerase 3 [Pyrinomonadaceae bacterium MAG19_C2-C3]